MMTAEKIITVMQVLLTQLEQTLSTAPQVAEASRTDLLKNQLQGYRDKVHRLQKVVRKTQDTDRRRKELDRENRRNR